MRTRDRVARNRDSRRATRYHRRPRTHGVRNGHRVRAVTVRCDVRPTDSHCHDRGTDNNLRRGGPETRPQPGEQTGEIAEVATPRRAEVARERSPRAEEQRLHGALTRLEHGSDLCVRALLPFAEEERLSLPLRQARERHSYVLRHTVVTPVDGRGNLEQPRVLRHLRRAAPPLRIGARQADVPRDREQPRCLRLGLYATAERAMDLQERLLDRVLGVRRPPEEMQAVPPDALGVAPVKRFGRERSDPLGMFDGGDGNPPGVDDDRSFPIYT